MIEMLLAALLSSSPVAKETFTELIVDIASILSGWKSLTLGV
jgi:hypothetical protein